MDVLKATPPPADQRLVYGTAAQNVADLRLPATPPGPTGGLTPLAVVVHGGFFRNAYDLEHLGHLCAALTGQGVATLNVEYRRIGDAGGGWPGSFDDVAAAVAFARKVAERHGLDRRLVLVGFSAGCPLAVWSARRRAELGLSVRGVVSLAGLLDMRAAAVEELGDGAVRELLGAAPDADPVTYLAVSPIEHLPLGLPHAVVHGTSDRFVPARMSERYCAAARAAADEATTLSLLEGADHLALVDPTSTAWPSVLDAVRRVARAATGSAP